MNFLIINHYAGAPGLGMELRPYYFGRELIKKGHKVTIIASAFSHYRTVQPDISRQLNKETIDGIDYIWIKTPVYKKNNLKRFYNILVFVLKLFWFKKSINHDSHFDIVISSSTYPLDIYPSRRFAKKHSAKHIFEVHDLWPLSPIVLGGMSKWNPFIIMMQIAENYAYSRCDDVISLLENAKDHMVEHGLEPSKFNYLPNGVNPGEWSDRPDNDTTEQSERIKRFKKKYKTVIGYTGAIGPANAMKTFIEAANILKDESFGFVLVGNGQEREYLVKMADSLKLENVIFLDPVKKEYLQSILSLFDILYIGYKNSELYKYGVSPNKLFDYIMAARPVVFGLGHSYSVIDKADSVHQAEPDDPGQVAELIREIANTGIKERNQSALNSKEYILNHYSFDVLSEKLLSIAVSEK